MNTLALVHAVVLVDEGFRDDLVVLVENGRIAALVDARDPRAGAALAFDCDGRHLLPGFIDTQVNGGGGVLFNDDHDPRAIAAIGAAHRRYGTTGFLPTLISDDLQVVASVGAAV
jgi:N-acetylglucosamine-6-phosphate deacetylase